jgi:N-acyl-D-amino-acid deacylase
MARYGGIYATHLRSENVRLLEAMGEAIRIGREAGVGVQLSHHKASGQKSWGKVAHSLAMIDEARLSGLDVWADQYPDLATSTDLGTLFPKWAHDGGQTALMHKLRDPEQRNALREYLLADSVDGWIADSGSWETVVVNFLHAESNRRFEGLNLAEIAALRGEHPVDTALNLMLEEQGNVGILHFVINDDDVVTVMKHPAMLIGSDATARSQTGPLNYGKPHPRSYGTFACILGKYVREDGVLTLEEAIARMTGLPAKRLKLDGRGVLAPGNYADITVFDPAAIRDTATYEQPHSPAAGIAFVLVNGKVVLNEGALVDISECSPGRALRRHSEDL